MRRRVGARVRRRARVVERRREVHALAERGALRQHLGGMIDRHVVIAGGHGRPGLCCRLEFLGAEFGCLAGVLGIGTSTAAAAARAAPTARAEAREWREAHRSHVTAAVRASSSKCPRLLKDVRETIEEEKHGRTSIVAT